jgi:hypothetical protein
MYVKKNYLVEAFNLVHVRSQRIFPVSYGVCLFWTARKRLGYSENNFFDSFMSALLEGLLKRPSPPDVLYYPLHVSAYDFGKLTPVFLFPAVLYGLAVVFVKTKHLYLLRTVLALMFLMSIAMGRLDIYVAVLMILTTGNSAKEYFSKEKAKASNP